MDKLGTAFKEPTTGCGEKQAKLAGITVSALPSITYICVVRTSDTNGRDFVGTKEISLVPQNVTSSAPTSITAENSCKKSVPRTIVYTNPGTTRALQMYSELPNVTGKDTQLVTVKVFPFSV